VVLDKFSRLGGRSAQKAGTLKSNLFGDGAVLSQDLDGARYAGSVKRSAGHVQTDFQFMTAVPGFLRKPESRPKLQFVGISRPRIEEIAAPTVRGNQHIFGPLTVRVAVKSGVPNDGVQQVA